MLIAPLRSRASFAYVVAIEGAQITLNLRDEHRGQVAAHREGLSSVIDTGALFGVESGARLTVMRVRSLSFVEPKEAHRAGVASSATRGSPLRTIVASTIGIIERRQEELRFIPDSLVAPPLGAEAFPLTNDEIRAVCQVSVNDETCLILGEAVRGFGPIQVGIQQLLPKHIAVLGGTGHGKSCFVAALMQQLLKLARPRIVVFDVNGEYADALRPHASQSGDYLETVLGGSDRSLAIPYYALGRHGLSRLLLPSEKTQRPALAFALENLPYVQWSGDGAALVGTNAAVFFDDCRPGNADNANAALLSLRNGTARQATQWPPMQALAALVADSHSLKPGRNGVERDAFSYGNVAPLVTRIKRCLDDPMFTSVVSVDGGTPVSSGHLNWRAESRSLVSRIFGDEATQWKVHVVDLRNVAHDLMPLILGSLLELFAFELFDRGQGNTHPTLLVLEEAHHYLRQFSESEEYGRQALAYERLAKEGRKFGLSLLISTQRPSEVSQTVLSQCGTWVTFRLSGDADLRAMAAASEWIDRQELAGVAGLPRQHALVFGAGVAMPIRIIAPTANPIPRSQDPAFNEWGRVSTDDESL